MRKPLLLAALLGSLTAASAQETVPREEALKVAFILSADLKVLLGTPIPTDPDVKRAVAVRGGDRGGLVLPECKLSATVLAKVAREVVPIGQLWLRHLIPQAEGRPVKPDQWLTVTVGHGDQTSPALLCALGMRRDAAGKMELLVYGKTKEPLLQVPFKGITAEQEDPLELSVQRQGEGALVTLKLLGQQEASFAVVPD